MGFTLFKVNNIIVWLIFKQHVNILLFQNIFICLVLQKKFMVFHLKVLYQKNIYQECMRELFLEWTSTWAWDNLLKYYCHMEKIFLLTHEIPITTSKKYSCHVEGYLYGVAMIIHHIAYLVIERLFWSCHDIISSYCI
jgi:hypothetical protein